MPVLYTTEDVQQGRIYTWVLRKGDMGEPIGLPRTRATIGVSGVFGSGNVDIIGKLGAVQAPLVSDIYIPTITPISADAQAVWPILDNASEIAGVTAVSFVRNR